MPAIRRKLRIVKASKPELLRERRKVDLGLSFREKWPKGFEQVVEPEKLVKLKTKYSGSEKRDDARDNAWDILNGKIKALFGFRQLEASGDFPILDWYTDGKNYYVKMKGSVHETLEIFQVNDRKIITALRYLIGK